MKSEEDVLLAEHDERLVRMMAQAHASSLIQLEALKLRFSHNEKLMALCAGTLALSFTAATAFHGQKFREGGATLNLLRSWQLFMFSIGSALVANWLAVTGVANFANSTFRKQISVHFDLLQVSLMKLNSEYAKVERDKWAPHTKRAAREEKISNVCIRLSAALGLLAQIAAFAAFAALYRFLKAVLAA